MKVILSRKGFDLQYGGMPSPILPDGTMLSLPIPSKDDNIKYSDLNWDGKSYYDLIHELKANSRIKEYYTCHLDPDIRKNITPRLSDWIPSFGQTGSALGHLMKQNIGIGDLFLFFGTFRHTELINGRLRYISNAVPVHVIYGYLQVGNIITSDKDIPEWLSSHPHVKNKYWEKSNAIYISSKTLSLCTELPGANCLKYKEDLVLTKKGCSKSIWFLPDFFRKIHITYNSKAWTADCFVSASKGQEFVLDANDEVLEWIKKLIK